MILLKFDDGCFYTFSNLKGHLHAGTDEVQPEFAKQKLEEMTSESSAGCPRKATLTLYVFYVLTHTQLRSRFQSEQVAQRGLRRGEHPLASLALGLSGALASRGGLLCFGAALGGCFSFGTGA